MLARSSFVLVSLGNQVDAEFPIAGVNTCPSLSFSLTTKSTESCSFIGVNGAHYTGEFMNTNIDITAPRLLPGQGPQAGWRVSVNVSDLHHSEINLHSIYNAQSVVGTSRRGRDNPGSAPGIVNVLTLSVFYSEVFQTFSSP